MDDELRQVEGEIRELLLDVARLSARIEAVERAYVTADNNVLQVIEFVREGLQSVADEVKTIRDMLGNLRSAHARTAGVTALFGTVAGGIIVAIVSQMM